jgi:hypothetical protein
MNSIVVSRKRGESISYLFRQKQVTNICLDDMIILNNIVRVCYKHNVPFTFKDIERLFNKIYRKEFHGSKEANKLFLSQYLKEESNVSKMEASLHETSKIIGDSGNDFSQDEELYAEEIK